MGENAVNRDKASDTNSERLLERLEKECRGCLTAEDAIAEIRRLEEATIGKIEEHHELWLEHEALKDRATRYREALERIRDAPLPQWNAKRIATRALEADHE